MINKPKYLYHASQNRNIEIFEPRAISVRDPNEGHVVFATPDIDLASVFLVPTNDSWCNSGLFGEIPYFVCSDEKRFKESDKGGAIYTLPSDTFENDPDRGLRSREWTSKIPVKPVKKEIYESGLKQMIDSKIQVYFVSKDKFEEIKTSKDHGNKILRESVSENKKLNKNVREIPKFD